MMGLDRFPRLAIDGFAAICLLLAVVTASAGVQRVRESLRRRRMLRRLGQPLEGRDDHALAAAIDADVLLEGVLAGAARTTTFVGAAHALEEAHPRAINEGTAPDGTVSELRIGKRRVFLGASLQVVLGTHEARTTRGGDVASVRAVFPGDVVWATGRLERVASGDRASEGTYRDGAATYALGSNGSLYARTSRRHALATTLMVALSLPLVGWSAATLAHMTRVTGPQEETSRAAAPRPACGGVVDAALAASDPWTARDRATACDDAEGMAKAAWILGDMAGAATAFAAWRARDPEHTTSLPEVESALLGDRTNSAAVVQRAEAEWYRGPTAGAAASLDCIAKDAAGTTAMTRPCAGGPAGDIFSHTRDGESWDNQPNYALHGPEVYARFVPPFAVADRTRWGSAYSDLEAASAGVHEANTADRRLLHFALTGETEQYTELAVAFDHLSKLYPSITAAKIEPADRTEDLQVSRDDLETARGELLFAAQKTLAVAATAAFFAFDEARVRAYLPNAESHARGILEEELRIQAGQQDAPESSHSPSDYWEGEMKLFADAASEGVGVDAVADEARQIDASPAVLAAIVGHRPALAVAVRRAMDHGYCSVRGEGLYALLQQAFRRRFAAHVVGDRELEMRWLGVTRSIGAALRADGAFFPLDSLESLLAKSG